MRDGLRKLRHAGTHLDSPSFSSSCPTCPFLGVCSLPRVPLSFFLPRRSPLARVLARSLAATGGTSGEPQEEYLLLVPLGLRVHAGHFGLEGETRGGRGAASRGNIVVGRPILFS